MKGSYYFKVKNKKVLFEFEIRRNITAIKGDSATGKTTLLHMLYEYLRVGRESGYSVNTDAKYYVYLRREVGRDWKDALLNLEDTVIFIEENNNFVFSQEFAEFVKKSGNYFVIINRAPLKMLPYSIHEIYEIITDGKRIDIKESYHEFRELYSNYPFISNNKMDNILVEDSNSGYQFFSYLLKEKSVYSANGNSNIIYSLKKIEDRGTLIIADGAAFGAMIEKCLEYFMAEDRKRITLWLPESFEYLILQSGIIQAKELENRLKFTSNYVESKKYVSWERYFTELLVNLTDNTEHKYSKHLLNEYYMQDRSAKKIIEKFPIEIKKIFVD